jgi:hypothetical protein
MLNLDNEIKSSLDLVKTNMKQYLISYDGIKREVIKKVN